MHVEPHTKVELAVPEDGPCPLYPAWGGGVETGSPASLLSSTAFPQPMDHTDIFCQSEGMGGEYGAWRQGEKRGREHRLGTV